MTLSERIQEVEHKIRLACERVNRPREEVEIIAVTKYVSLETTRQVLDSGLMHIGENRWQDAKDKWEALGDRGTWHFIGHLQTNKVREVIGRFHWIHSLDRLSLAKEIHKRASKQGFKIPCLVQVNVSGEESKHGLDPEEVFDFVNEVKGMDHIQLSGLMTMAPLVDNPEEARPVFRKLKELKDVINAQLSPHLHMRHLSMGMSNDYEVAIEEGATMVRLGSTLVGREYEA